MKVRLIAQKILGLSSCTLLALGISACQPDSKPSSETAAPTQAQAQTQTQTASDEGSSKESESAKANAFFERVFEENAARSPETLTFLGRKERADEWNDLSKEFSDETLALNKKYLAELESTINRDSLDSATQLSYDLFKQGLEEDIEDARWRLYNYPVNQMFGRHSRIVSLLINQHRIESLQDAENYISRLNKITLNFDQLITGIEARTAANIIPPKFVFPHVIRDSKNIITGAPFDDGEPSALLADFTKKITALAEKDTSLDDDAQQALIQRANDALTNSLQPAYQKLIDHLTQLESKANTDDGVWKWKDGAEFFNVALKRTTTTDLTADQIHEIGLSEVERIHGEMRAIKDKVGFEGDLKAFMQFMREDGQFYYTSDEEGRSKYLSEATELIDTMKGKIDEMFITKPKADISVRAVEPFREQSAGKAFYQRPSEDGSRPGLYYANLYDMKSMPTYQMEALAYHEGIPGHHMQLAIQQELQGIPKFRRFGGYTAYIEGWGLYSEYLPKEFGFYSDPYSDFGRLAMELWRACRLVVDTGIHSKKWTRQQGIDYYTSNTPNATLDAVKMVERHVVMPSQATAYKIGMLKIQELRKNARESLGDKFDIREYHDEVLKYGPLPLNVVEAKVDAWVESKKNS